MKDMEVFFEKQLERTNYWLSFAEAKNGALIAADAAGIVGLLQIPEMKSCINDYKFCIIGLLVLSLLLSLICALISFIPNLSSEKNKGKSAVVYETDNMFYFGHIAKIASSDIYIKECASRYFWDTDIEYGNRYIKDIADEILMNSYIAMEKYKWFNIALKINFCGALAWGMLKIIRRLKICWEKFKCHLA